MPDEAQQQDPNMVTLAIDGREVTVPKGTLVVEAAKKLNIEIPVFCYHHKLDPVGACRMCVVEITPGPPKAQVACTTPVAQGMSVRTNSTMAVAARADVLEFELVNHPLDCPVCDKGGECPLQDYTFRHGYPVSRIDAPRVHFQKPIPLSENIALDRERCVLCYRCTRYYDEVAWEQELTTDERGVRSFITSQFGEPLTSNFSGNIIDLCPVGALTSRVWRFESRPWDMDHTSSVCSKCSVGCNVTQWQRRGELVRITSHENDQVDDGWICDRGRFNYTDVNSPGRLQVPLVGGESSTWEAALQALVDGTKGKKLGILLRRDTTNEELFLVSRLIKGPWKNAKVAIEGRTALPARTDETLAIKDVEDAATVVVVASDTADDVPVINLRVKKAVKKLGRRLIVLHPDKLDLDRTPAEQLLHVRYEPGHADAAVREVAGHEWLKDGPIAILYGDGRGAEDTVALTAAVNELAHATGAGVMPLYRATNERGALALNLAGRPEDLEGCQAVICVGPPAGALPKSATFVAVWDYLLRPEHGVPDVVLPAVSFAETQGSYTNVEGRVQFLRPALQIEPPLREAWDVLCEIGQRLGITDLDFTGIFQIQRAAAQATPELSALADPPAPEPLPTPVLYGPARP